MKDDVLPGSHGARLFDFEALFAELTAEGFGDWASTLREATAHALAPDGHGSLPQWLDAWKALPAIVPEQVALDVGRVSASGLITDATRESLRATLRQFHPWRKGPFELFGVSIDTEWRSDWKWERRFESRWAGGGRVLDVGCGTGLVAEELAARPVDGLDISAEMLGVAAEKGVYGRLIEGDLTARLAIADNSYAGLISAGTFTHGHVGPEALDELVRIAASGALFVFGVNAEVFRELDFGARLSALESAGRISQVELVEGRIYDDAARHDTADDRFLATVFRKPV